MSLNKIISSERTHRYGLTLLLFAGFISALCWAKARDPYRRVESVLTAPGGNRAKVMVVLPRSAKVAPVAVCLLDAAGTVPRPGAELRQFADLGLAAVGFELDGPAASFDQQFAALRNYLSGQSWADTNAVAWIGSGSGAQRLFSFAGAHPETQPRLIVRVSDGRAAGAAQTIPALRCSVLLVHEKADDVSSDPTRDFADALKGKGAAVDVRALPMRRSDSGIERGVASRGVAEYCAAFLGATQRLRVNDRSFWYYWLPFTVAAVLFLAARCRRWRQSLPAAHGPRTASSKVVHAVAWLLGAAAVAQSTLHLVLPRLPASDTTLTLTRRWLVRPALTADFDWLAGLPVWKGRRVNGLLEHVELADLQSKFFYPDLAAEMYRNYVLSPVIDPDDPLEPKWRRPLWENFYPRIRRETDPMIAAEMVVSFLRQWVTIAPEPRTRTGIETTWNQGLTDAAGFENIYVAALRSVGIAARRAESGRAELWTGAKWSAAPRPPFSSWVATNAMNAR